QDRCGDASRRRAGRPAENSAAGVSHVLHRLGGERRAADGSGHLRLRPPPAGRCGAMTIKTIAIAAAIAVAASTAAVHAEKTTAKTASYALAFHGVVSAYRDTAMFVLPGARVVIDAVGGPAGDYAVATEDGIAEQLALRRWRWTAPDRPGIATLR